jgi:hypothetical protein
MEKYFLKGERKNVLNGGPAGRAGAVPKDLRHGPSPANAFGSLTQCFCSGNERQNFWASRHRTTSG